MRNVLGSMPKHSIFFSHLKVNGYERIYKYMKGYWQGGGPVGAGRREWGSAWWLAMDIYHGYVLWIS
jgi:hypothetical protein